MRIVNWVVLIVFSIGAFSFQVMADSEIESDVRAVLKKTCASIEYNRKLDYSQFNCGFVTRRGNKFLPFYSSSVVRMRRAFDEYRAKVKKLEKKYRADLEKIGRSEISSELKVKMVEARRYTFESDIRKLRLEDNENNRGLQLSSDGVNGRLCEPRVMASVGYLVCVDFLPVAEDELYAGSFYGLIPSNGANQRNSLTDLSGRLYPKVSCEMDISKYLHYPTDESYFSDYPLPKECLGLKREQVKLTNHLAIVSVYLNNPTQKNGRMVAESAKELAGISDER